MFLKLHIGIDQRTSNLSINSLIAAESPERHFEVDDMVCTYGESGFEIVWSKTESAVDQKGNTASPQMFWRGACHPWPPLYPSQLSGFIPPS